MKQKVEKKRGERKSQEESSCSIRFKGFFGGRTAHQIDKRWKIYLLNERRLLLRATMLGFVLGMQLHLARAIEDSLYVATGVS